MNGTRRHFVGQIGPPGAAARRLRRRREMVLICGRLRLQAGRSPPGLRQTSLPHTKRPLLAEIQKNPKPQTPNRERESAPSVGALKEPRLTDRSLSPIFETIVAYFIRNLKKMSNSVINEQKAASASSFLESSKRLEVVYKIVDHSSATGDSYLLSLPTR